MVSMGLKKKGKKSTADKPQNRSQGASRARQVLQIVVTDSTFEPTTVRNLSCPCEEHSKPRQEWVGKCIHCNTLLLVSQEGATTATIEHIVPLCAGGSNQDVRNLALACSRCNGWKGSDHDAKKLSERAKEVIAALQSKRLARWRDRSGASVST